jgi:hypothetical protein
VNGSENNVRFQDDDFRSVTILGRFTLLGIKFKCVNFYWL